MSRETIKHKEVKTGKTWYKKEYKPVVTSDFVALGDKREYHPLINNNKIKLSGFDMFEITDNVFAEDISYISWNNQTLLIHLLTKYFENQDVEKELSLSFEKSEGDMKKFNRDLIGKIRVFYASNEEIQKFFETNQFTLTNSTLNKTLLNKGASLYKVLKVIASSASYEIFNLTNLISAIKKAFPSEGHSILKDTYVQQFLQKAKSLDGLSMDVYGETFSSLLKKVGTKILFAVNVASFLNSLGEAIINSSNDYVNVKAVYDAVIGAANVAISSVAALSATIPVPGQLVAAGLLVFDILIKIIKVGNGHTIYENFNDQGLNDWEYQWKYNAKNMLEIALYYSDNLKYGVTWKVTDGWFSLPNLYISKSKLEGSKYRYQDWDYKLLSPGNEFNYGNKIKMKK
ncbi:hypothetical protein [Mycoplasma hafezii]|uniref:hypothetical protein n=1 Tax=Mycoplasma hafezii TaxID=525886 RepID=UPI003CF74088